MIIGYLGNRKSRCLLIYFFIAILFFCINCIDTYAEEKGYSSKHSLADFTGDGG